MDFKISEIMISYPFYIDISYDIWKWQIIWNTVIKSEQIDKSDAESSVKIIGEGIILSVEFYNALEESID